MAHSVFRDRLIALANETADNPSGFLEGLSDIHADWHGVEVPTYGFLLFHHRVVRYYNSIVNAQLNPPVTAFTAADFKNMNVQPFADKTTNIDTLVEMADFSDSVQSWHNTAHMQIGMATGAPMMDPRQNVFFRPFWRLHYYIEKLFQTVLLQYGNKQHPGQFVDDTAIASHLEVSHHSWVPRI